MATVLLPYNMVSEGAEALANELEITRIRRENSRYKHKPENIIINWGCPARPPHIPEDAKVINKFDAVHVASNKLLACQAMRGRMVRMPDWTTSRNAASDWVADGSTVVARTVLNGHAGRGIVLVKDLNEMVDAPLYTRYIPKKSEYRVHVVASVIIDVTRKVLREDYPNKEQVNWMIRNHDNGFIFQRYNNAHRDAMGNPKEELHCCPPDVKIQALNAIRALNLDFGAVDVIYNVKHNRAYVLEVNTAPGIADTACSRYANRLRDYIFDMMEHRNLRERPEDNLIHMKMPRNGLDLNMAVFQEAGARPAPNAKLKIHQVAPHVFFEPDEDNLLEDDDDFDDDDE